MSAETGSGAAAEAAPAPAGDAPPPPGNGGGGESCPVCDAPLPRVHEGSDGASAVERAGCMSCGLQLVRRPGGRWETIRG